MSIKNIQDQRRIKELRDKYERERQVIQVEIDKLQAQLDVLDAYLGDNLDNEWHSKPPLSNDKIAENRLQIRNLHTLKCRGPLRLFNFVDFFDMKNAKNHVPATNPGDPPDFPLRGG